MDNNDKLCEQVAVLREVIKDYPTATLRNAIQQIEGRIKEIEKQNGNKKD